MNTNIQLAYSCFHVFNMVYDNNICKLVLDICILNPGFLSKSPLEPLLTTNVGVMVQYVYCTYTYCVSLNNVQCKINLYEST